MAALGSDPRNARLVWRATLIVNANKKRLCGNICKTHRVIKVCVLCIAKKNNFSSRTTDGSDGLFRTLQSLTDSILRFLFFERTDSFYQAASSDDGRFPTSANDRSSRVSGKTELGKYKIRLFSLFGFVSIVPSSYSVNDRTTAATTTITATWPFPHDWHE